LIHRFLKEESKAEKAARVVEAAKDRVDNTPEDGPRLRRKIHVSPKKAVLGEILEL
jgi:hypothetical protein